MLDIRPKEPVKPQAGGILPSQSAHLETETHKHKEPRLENLTHLIHEAQKRSEQKRRSSDKKKRDKALMIYANLRDYEEIADTFGLNLDREV